MVVWFGALDMVGRGLGLSRFDVGQAQYLLSPSVPSIALWQMKDQRLEVTS